MRITSRRGLHRVAGGFSLDVGRVHLIVSRRPGRDVNGYRTVQILYVRG